MIPQVRQSTPNSMSVSLSSTLAHRLLCNIASSKSNKEFRKWIASVYGKDISKKAISNLQDNLVNGVLESSEIEIVPRFRLHGHHAAYNNVTGSINISYTLVERAGSSNSHRIMLFAALVEEYGHFIDAVLRKVRAGEPGISADARLDEGALFGKTLLERVGSGDTPIPFCTIESNGSRQILSVTEVEMKQASVEYYSETEILRDDRNGIYEFFGAGTPSNPNCMTHKTIENNAIPDAFTPLAERIYYGNWTRDYSQFVDVFGLIFVERDTILSITNLLGYPEFKTTKAKDCFHETDVSSVPLRMELGLYLSWEHIDNPDGYSPETKRLGLSGKADAELKDEFRAAELELDTSTKMKRYIKTTAAQMDVIDGGYSYTSNNRGGKQNWMSAMEYIESEILSSYSNRRDDRLRCYHLGNALHTLEDFFAHSNFVELALIKIGETTPALSHLQQIDPWVPSPYYDWSKTQFTDLMNATYSRSMSLSDYTPLGTNDSFIPLVTGSFGAVDAVVSIADKIADALYIKLSLTDFEEPHISDAQAWQPSNKHHILTAILEDPFLQQAFGVSTAASTWKMYLYTREKIEKIKSYIPGFDFLMAPFNLIINQINEIKKFAVYYTVSQLVTELRVVVSDYQTKASNYASYTPPNSWGFHSHDPTHTLLAKDCPDHHFHKLAADLAEIVVKHMVPQMDSCWKGSKIDNAIDLARDVIRHPWDIDQLNPSPEDLLGIEIMDYCQTWATTNMGTSSVTDFILASGYRVDTNSHMHQSILELDQAVAELEVWQTQLDNWYISTFTTLSGAGQTVQQHIGTVSDEIYNGIILVEEVINEKILALKRASNYTINGLKSIYSETRDWWSDYFD